MKPDRLSLLRNFFFVLIISVFSISSVHAQLVDSLVIEAVSTAPVFSKPLLANVDYEITCRGTFSLWRDSNNDPAGKVDAKWFIDIPDGEFGNGLEPLITNVTTGFLMNQQPITAYTYSPSSGVSPTNTYVVSFRGTGAPLELFIEDHPIFGVDRHPDNSGFLIIEIRRISPKVSVNTNSIDFGDVLVGTSKDSLVIFHNSGKSGLVVTLSNITGANAADFAVLGSGSFIIFQNQDSTVGFRFTPSGLGKRYGSVIFNTNDPQSPQVQIDLEGNGVAPTIAVNPASIDFGEVELGSFKDTSIEIQNTGTALLMVNQLTYSGGNPGEYSVISPSPFTVQGGQTRNVIIRFTPTSIRRKDAFLDIRSNANGMSTKSIAVTGVGVTTLTAGFSSSSRGAPEQIVLIPVELFENRSGSDATSFEFLVRYNYRILYPRRVLNANTLSQTFSMNMSPLRVGAIKIEGTNGQALNGTGTLAYIECLVLFGDTTYSPLTMDSLKFNDGNPRARIRNGIFNLDSACNQFLRQIVEVGVAQLRQNTPNPFNPSTMISYSIPVDQHVQLEIFDNFGRHVETLINADVPAGEYKIQYTPQDLASGTYYYRLKTIDGMKMKRMIILR